MRSTIYSHLVLCALLAGGSFTFLSTQGCGGVTSVPIDDPEVFISLAGAANPLASGANLVPVLAGRVANDVVALRLGSPSAAARLYAPIEGTPGSLAIVQTGTNQLVANINVGNSPVAVAVNDNATRAYVANFASDSVTVINLGTNTVVTTVALSAGSRPIRLTTCLDGKLYVSNRDTNTVSVIDMATNAITATIPVGQSPSGIVALPDGSAVYVASSSGNAIGVIDTLSGTLGPGLTVTRPFGLALNSTGTDLFFTAGNTSVGHTDTTTLAPPNSSPVVGALEVAVSPYDTTVATLAQGPSRLDTQQGSTFGSIPLPGRATGLSYTRVVSGRAPVHTVDTIPQGMKVRVDGVDATAPASFTWTPGTSHTITVPTPQIVSPDTRMVWSNWSDGGALSHAVTAPATNAVYNASFAFQFQLTTATIPPFTTGLSVTANPSSPDGFYAAGTTVTLTASSPPTSGLIFGEWRDDLSGSLNPETILLSAARKVTAVYDTTPTIGASVNQRGPTAGNGYSHTMVLENARNEAYTDFRITSIQWAVNGGLGIIVNTTQVPILIGALAPNGQTSPITITATIPGSITLWTYTVSGTIKNAAGRTLAWRTAVTVQR